MTVSILNLGIGNVTSMANALRALDQEPKICDTALGVLEADHLVVPGVGSFLFAMQRVQQLRLLDALRARVLNFERPTLGVCLGAQLFFELGTEGGTVNGIAVVPGSVRRINVGSADLRLPHTGWNKVEADPVAPGYPIVPGYYYFNHEYHCVPSDSSVGIAHTYYGESIMAAYRFGALWGYQFHPEKSQQAGLSALTAFLGNSS